MNIYFYLVILRVGFKISSFVLLENSKIITKYLKKRTSNKVDK